MSKIQCRCGHLIQDIQVPCPDLLLALPDENVWSVVTQVVSAHGSEHPTDLVAAAIAHASIPIYRCTECGRLLVFWNGSDANCAVYTPEPNVNGPAFVARDSQ